MSQPLYHDIIAGIYHYLSLPVLLTSSRISRLWNQSLYTTSFSFHSTVKFIRSVKLSDQIEGLSRSRLSRNISSLECVGFELDDLLILKTFYHKLAIKSLIFSNRLRPVCSKKFLIELIPMMNNIQKFKLLWMLKLSDLNTLANLLTYCHSLTDLSINGLYLSDDTSIMLLESFRNCLLLKKLDLSAILDNFNYCHCLCSLLPQYLSLEEIYLGDHEINSIRLLITVIPQCLNLILFQFTLIPNKSSDPENQKSELERILLQMFREVCIVKEVPLFNDIYIFTASKRNQFKV